MAIIPARLISKYASFGTRPFLAATHALFKALCEVNREAFLSSAIRALDFSINRVFIKANSATNYFVLLNWGNLVLQLTSGKNEDLVKYLPNLVRWQATLLQRCLAETKKKGLRASAVRTTRACMRQIFQLKNCDITKMTIKKIIEVLAGPNIAPFAAAVALGMVAGVSSRLRSKIADKVVESHKNIFYEFFVREIMGSTSRIPPYVMVCFLLSRYLVKG